MEQLADRDTGHRCLNKRPSPVSKTVRLMRRPTRVLGSSAGPAKLPRNLGELAYSAIAVICLI